MLYTVIVNSRVSAFICCIIYPNLIIFYKTGIVWHSYKNKANNVRLLPVFTGFCQFFHCSGKNTFCHDRNPALQRTSLKWPILCWVGHKNLISEAFRWWLAVVLPCMQTGECSASSGSDITSLHVAESLGAGGACCPSEQQSDYADVGGHQQSGFH